MKDRFDISAITIGELDKLRMVADHQADDVVARIISSGFERQISEVFVALAKNERINSNTFSGFTPELSLALAHYFEETRKLPTWADPHLVKKGEKVFSLYGPAIFMLLNVSSLPLCYTCANGAKVLFDTGRLLHHNKGVAPVAKRLMDTAQMILDVMLPGGLAKGGKGIITIQKVRIIHSVTRYYLKKQGGNEPWDIKRFGEPINQEDMAGTLMSFAPVILSGLRHLNAGLSKEEMDAYMHCWKIVGYMMGIDIRLLPDTYEEGLELAAKILKHQASESAEGKALTQSCIRLVNAIVPGNNFKEMPHDLILFFMKDFSDLAGMDLCKCIGVEANAETKDRIVLSLTKFAVGKFSRLDQDALLRRITPLFNRLLLQGIMNLFNRKKTPFSIPLALQKDWIVTDEVIPERAK